MFIRADHFQIDKISDEILKVLPKQKAEKYKKNQKDPITEIGSSDLESLFFENLNSSVSFVQLLCWVAIQ